MAIRKMKPITNGTRHMSRIVNDELDKVRPEKSLTVPLKSAYGRDNYGHRTCRDRQKGHKRLYRIIDFKRNKLDVPARVATIEYDPKKGDIVSAGSKADIKPGNALKLKDMPVGVQIHNVELQKGKGGQLVRSAGTAARLVAKEGTYCHVELPSGELRLIHGECMATVGEVGNSEHNLVSIGKAGRARHMGKRPHVRGAVMNPVDHPHGGGEGKNSVGRKSPLTPWGKPALGIKTRGRKTSDKFIVRRRNEK